MHLPGRSGYIWHIRFRTYDVARLGGHCFTTPTSAWLISNIAHYEAHPKSYQLRWHTLPFLAVAFRACTVCRHHSLVYLSMRDALPTSMPECALEEGAAARLPPGGVVLGPNMVAALDVGGNSPDWPTSVSLITSFCSCKRRKSG